MQMLAQPIADVAQPLHGNAQPFQIVTSELVAYRRLDSDEHAERRCRRRIPGASGRLRRRIGQSPHVPGHFSHDTHVGHTGSGILGHDIGAIEPLDRTPHRADQFGRLVLARIADDHALAAALRQSGQRRLVGHATRQSQHISQRFVLTAVRPHAAAAESGAEMGAVHGDDPTQTDGGVMAIAHGLVVIEFRVLEQRHERGPLG